MSETELLCVYTIHDVPNGTWYFAAYAYNDAGGESPASSEVSAVFDCGVAHDL
jgi:hypothetical protein